MRLSLWLFLCSFSVCLSLSLAGVIFVLTVFEPGINLSFGVFPQARIPNQVTFALGSVIIACSSYKSVVAIRMLRKWRLDEILDQPRVDDLA